ncbi:MAG TPA: DUF1343 domain-containing protein [Candidatus Paceibacterota bacterium]|nr:DUF1343 domain-containing protein [Verrucomicrobiota bacterium]HSA12763.1 DUF1343 domain-containing protein [Candidatus Paceibacterota bacterium]
MKTLILPFLVASLSLSCAARTEVKLGNEVLAEENFKVLQGKRIGLITNPSGVNRNLESTVEVLRAAPGVQLVALFGPEHGIYGDVEAGDKVDNQVDARTGLPAYSLYGKTQKPTPEMLKGLDALVYDLQDTGCRSYTYITTMGVAMEACGEAGIEFVVLDRPNPLGGERIEGAMLDPQFRSGVSRWNVPYVYSLTCGELARMINGEGLNKKSCRLTVVPMKGWKRSMVWEDTGLPWVPSSPHVPHGQSALYQVATGMLGELMSVSIGIGYTLPFECVASPGLNPHKLAEALNACHLPGVKWRPITYKPYYFTFTNQVIGGAQLYFSDPRRAPLTAINLYAIETLKQVGGIDAFAEADKRKRGFGMFDKVNGTDATRKALQAGTPAAEVVASWKAGEDAFRKARQKYLLY